MTKIDERVRRVRTYVVVGGELPEDLAELPADVRRTVEIVLDNLLNGYKFKQTERATAARSRIRQVQEILAPRTI